MNTKEFAKNCGVEKRTLFYYDEIGLLKPVRVRENGYREYSEMQIVTMETIKLLQSAGLSLAEIKEVLSNEVPGKNIEIINECEQRVLEKIRHLSDGRNYIRHRMALRESYMKNIGNVLFTEHMSEKKLAILKLEYRPHMQVGYRSVGHYLGVAEDPETLRPKYFFKYAREDDMETVIFPEGEYICKFVKSNEAVFIPSLITEFKGSLSERKIETTGLMYIEDLPNWLIDNSSRVILRLSARLR